MKNFNPFSKQTLMYVGFACFVLLYITAQAWQPVIKDDREQEIILLRQSQAENDIKEAKEKERYEQAVKEMTDASERAEELRKNNEAADKKINDLKTPPKSETPPAEQEVASPK